MAEIGKGHSFAAEIGPHGRNAKVWIDGNSVGHVVERMEIDVDARKATHIVLHCYKPTAGRFRIEGTLHVEGEEGRLALQELIGPSE